MTRRVVARAPTRIDLGGGWTDVPPYCDHEGGFVCNVAITRYATATISDAPRDMQSDASALESGLVDAVIRRRSLPPARVDLGNDFPVGAGLGGSSAASAALLVAAAGWRGESWDRRAVAEAGRQIEVEDLGVAGGRQDHYAATFGGALRLTFGAGSSVGVEPIVIDGRTRDQFAARSLLVYTGQSRISGDTITAVLGAYEHRVPRVVQALRRMRELAGEMATAMARADLDAVGGLLDEHWAYQRSLHPSIPTPLIDEIIRCALAAGALGAKAMGASGGGCVFMLAPADGSERVRTAVAALGTIVDFHVDTDGVRLLEGHR